MKFVEWLDENTLSKETIEEAHKWLMKHLEKSNHDQVVFPLRSTGKFQDKSNREQRAFLKITASGKNVVFCDNELPAWLYHELHLNHGVLNKSFQLAITSKKIPIADSRAKRESDGDFLLSTVPRTGILENKHHKHIFDAGLYIAKDHYYISDDELKSKFFRFVHPINYFLFPKEFTKHPEQNNSPSFQFVAACYMKRKCPEVFNSFIEIIKPNDCFKWNPEWEAIGNEKYEQLEMPSRNEKNNQLKGKVIKDQNINGPTNREENIQRHNVYSKSLTIEKTRFYVDQKIFDELSKGEYDSLIINVVLGKANNNHPVGQYVIPRDVIINFIETKLEGDNWKKNKDFKSVSIPIKLRKYFFKQN